MLLPSLQHMIVQYCAPLKNNEQQQQLHSRTNRSNNFTREQVEDKKETNDLSFSHYIALLRRGSMT
jgi:hypothetical protein